MKKIIPMTAAAVALAAMTSLNISAQNTANGQDDSVQKRRERYVLTAREVAKEKNNTGEMVSLIKQSIRAATNNGAKGAEKNHRLGEIIVTHMALSEDWPIEKRLAVVKTLAAGSVELAGADGAAKVAFTKHAFATLYATSKDSMPLYSALDAIPEVLHDTAKESIETAQTILSATTMTEYRDLYDFIRLSIDKDPGAADTKDTPFIMDPTIVTVTTTTTTSTTTTTTTTYLTLDGTPRPRPAPVTTTTTVRPRPIPTTTKPSVSPPGGR